MNGESKTSCTAYNMAIDMNAKSKVIVAWLTIRLFLEVGAVEAVPRARPLLLVVHKEEVEEADTGLRQPGKRMPQVVVTANKSFKFNPFMPGDILDKFHPNI